jgi:hypothetical protein
MLKLEERRIIENIGKGGVTLSFSIINQGDSRLLEREE